ncbi:hypothetical protein B5C34_03745 [Pacificimonas flava]|uniref:Uncharacterized protein n=2 Tax=Pacificimonas TaxID=1960290 RepID=A0A219B4B3_9SPHN|nr:MULTISPECIES: ribonuclease [Pacificimonas]MBZ6377670.1 ribonuclease [Pacificimonas aurantium]OWV32649.1 hypothetical protein B5C34_03745 [Pacificimonas flava]
MSDWIVEDGIGEIRAARLGKGGIAEARIVREGRLHAGQVVRARLTTKQGKRGLAEAGGEVLQLDPWPASAAEGEERDLVVTRGAIPERGRPRDAKARPAMAADEPHPPAPEGARPGDLSDHGWEELMEEARSGVVARLGCTLSIVPTPAGTTIDIDGDLAPRELASRGAEAVAAAILRLDIGGSILIDFPSLEGKGDRTRLAAIFDDAFDAEHERTAINGFGLMQVVRPRFRPSLLELAQNLPAESRALDLLRRAGRGAGAATSLELRAGEAVTAWLSARPHLIERLEARQHLRIALKAHGSDPLWAGDVHAV